MKVIRNERRTQREIAAVFGTTEVVIRRWYVDIINEMNIKVVINGSNSRLTYEYEGKIYD